MAPGPPVLQSTDLAGICHYMQSLGQLRWTSAGPLLRVKTFGILGEHHVWKGCNHSENIPEFRGRIGVARKDITPPVGIYSRTWGSAKHDMAEGVHRPLFGSCLVFQQSDRTAELVFFALDTIVLDPVETATLRATLHAAASASSAEQLMLHPSHSTLHALAIAPQQDIVRAGI